MKLVLLCTAWSYNVNELLLENVLGGLLGVQYMNPFLEFSGVLPLHNVSWHISFQKHRWNGILYLSDENRQTSLDGFPPVYNSDWLGRSSLNFNITIPYKCNRRLCNLKEATAKLRIHSHRAKAIAKSTSLTDGFLKI